MYMIFVTIIWNKLQRVLWQTKEKRNHTQQSFAEKWGSFFFFLNRRIPPGICIVRVMQAQELYYIVHPNRILEQHLYQESEYVCYVSAVVTTEIGCAQLLL